MNELVVIAGDVGTDQTIGQGVAESLIYYFRIYP